MVAHPGAPVDDGEVLQLGALGDEELRHGGGLHGSGQVGRDVAVDDGRLRARLDDHERAAEDAPARAGGRGHGLDRQLDLHTLGDVDEKARVPPRRVERAGLVVEPDERVEALPYEGLVRPEGIAELRDDDPVGQRARGDRCRAAVGQGQRRPAVVGGDGRRRGLDRGRRRVRLGSLEGEVDRRREPPVLLLPGEGGEAGERLLRGRPGLLGPRSASQSTPPSAAR